MKKQKQKKEATVLGNFESRTAYVFLKIIYLFFY